VKEHKFIAIGLLGVVLGLFLLTALEVRYIKEQNYRGRLQCIEKANSPLACELGGK